MCGIFGYVGPREATPLIMEGLARLEYRGYDSTGLAVIDHGQHFEVRKTAGKLQNLTDLVRSQPLSGTGGVGHTRWATHGTPTDENAHPHTDATNSIVVVHNGIVENYLELKKRLVEKGYIFTSATDSEVIPHLIQEYLAQGNPFQEAARLAANELQGAHAIATMYAGEPDTLLALRIGNAGGLSVGYGREEMLLASDLPALMPLTNSVAFLAPGEMAVLRPTGASYSTLEGEPIERGPQILSPSPLTAAKSGYNHFMMKEIMEQPDAAMNALRGRLSFTPTAVTLAEVPFTRTELRELHRVVVVAVGTSYHAAQVGAQLIERLARLPASAENAAEFRYRHPVLDHGTLVVSVGQSGETADTLGAMRHAVEGHAQTLTICNVEGSQATRMAEATILMHAGPEVGVASSKTFTNAMVCLYLLAVHLGAHRGTLKDAQLHQHLKALAQIPALLGRALELNQDQYAHITAHYAQYRRFLFVGRGLLEPMAREGALKLKEISYIHAEGLSAAELKHGPIALVDPETPVVALALQDALYDKMLGNISEVRARNGPVLAIATEGDQRIVQDADHVLWVPACPPELAPMVTAVPLQLFAYHTAVYCGSDVDQPRNLAKTVTVE
jgi:glucosamine--fructose-6-phosphate aminotransferase (isomerizing)